VTRLLLKNVFLEMKTNSMRVKLFFGTLLFLLLNATILSAQCTGPGCPCDGTDIDTGCPIDSWVTVLAVVAMIFAAWHLYKQKKKCAIV